MTQTTLSAEQARVLAKGPFPDYPFIPKSFVHPNGLTQSYLDEGEGDPVLMLHGNPSWSYYWRHLVLGLRDDYRCIVPDHIGMGLSDKPDDKAYSYTLRSRIQDLDRLLSHLDLGDDLTLAVHDWGGMIGFGWALKHGARIKRLIILNTASFPLPASKPMPWQLKLGRDYNLGALAIRGFNAFAAGATRQGVVRPMPADVQQAYEAPYDSWKHRIATLRFVQDIPLAPGDRAWDLVEEAGKRLASYADRPAYLGWGLQDFVFDHHFLKGFEDALPRAEKQVYEDAGHYVLEDKHEVLVPRLAAEAPDRIAMRCPGTRGPGGFARHDLTLSYRDLDQRSDAIAAGLAKHGITRGTRAVVMVRPSPEFFLLMFALFKAGAVPVLVDPGIDKRALKQCLDEAQPEAFIGIPLAQFARMLLRWAPSARTRITVGRRWFWGGASLAEVEASGAGAGPQLADTAGEDVAAILFTSGSTGVPKGVVYRHRHFVAQIDLLRDAFGIQPGGVDMPTFPPFALFDPALGLSSIIPDMDPTQPAKADPRKLLHAMKAFGVDQLFGSPALMKVLADHGEKLDGLRRVTSAGAPVPADVVARIRALLPEDAQFWTPYGATECLPVAVIEGRELQATREATEQGAGTCVGRPVPPNEVRIIAITDEPLADWSQVQVLGAEAIGEITVAGPTATDEYFNRPQATALAKIRETLPDGRPRVVHRMGDLGRFDAEGRLWFCGRKSHRVRTAEGNLYTEQVEPVFNTHPEVARTALVGVGEGGGQRPVLCVEMAPKLPMSEHERVLDELRGLGRGFVHTARIHDFLIHPGFPVDIRHNAKIGREQLAAWAAKQPRLPRRTA